jgi:tRNA (cmo5U34)-methyltransferase
MFLTLMFIPTENRRKLIERLISLCNAGGALIIVDKFTPKSGYIASIFHRLTLAGKLATGTEPRDIIMKELSIAGVQRPMPENLLGYICPNATEFFRFGEFAGWIVEAAE